MQECFSLTQKQRFAPVLVHVYGLSGEEAEVAQTAILTDLQFVYGVFERLAKMLSPDEQFERKFSSMRSQLSMSLDEGDRLEGAGGVGRRLSFGASASREEGSM